MAGGTSSITDPFAFMKGYPAVEKESFPTWEKSRPEKNMFFGKSTARAARASQPGDEEDSHGYREVVCYQTLYGWKVTVDYDPRYHYNIHTLAEHYGVDPMDIVDNLDKFEKELVRYAHDRMTIFDKKAILSKDIASLADQYAAAGGLFQHLVA